MSRWFIEVTDAGGNTMQLRHGAIPGEGAIVYFGSRLDAEMAVETFSPGLNADDTVAIRQARHQERDDVSGYFKELRELEEGLPDVAGDHLNGSISQHYRRLLVCLDEEQRKVNPDTALIGVLCDGVRFVREHIALVNKELLPLRLVAPDSER